MPYNKAMTRRKSVAKKKPGLSEETIKSVAGLGVILRKIHNRLMAEGKIIKRGKIITPT